MSIQIKLLASGTKAGSTSPESLGLPASGKAWVVTNMRFFNKSATASMVQTVTVNDGTGDLVLAKVTIPPNAAFIEDNELSLEHVNELKYSQTVALAFDYVISGIERDV